MELMKLFAEIQANPGSCVAYRRLAAYYRAAGLPAEAAAFDELIRRRFDADGADLDEERRGDGGGGH
jgi:hypothetical protein